MIFLPRRRLSPEETRRCNAEITALLSLYLNLAPDAAAAEEIRQIAADCQVDEEYAFAEYLAALCDVDSLGKDKDFFRNYFPEMIHKLSKEEFEQDPFYLLLRASGKLKKEVRRGRFTLKTLCLKPAEAFVCGDFLVHEDGRMIPQIGFFMDPYEYPAVLENGREWMTLLPNETITSKPAISEAKGKVLTYGLGLGYFCYMAARKDEVQSVTAVERSADAIALFREEILPLFPAPLAKKITLVQEDAFVYAEQSMPKENFHFVFTDIWHDVGDGREQYLRMKRFEERCPNTVFSYWLEDSIRCYLNPSLWPE